MHQLSTLDLSAQDSFEFWREITRGTYDLAKPQKMKPELRLDANLWYAGDLILSEFSCQANVKWRSDLHIRNDGRPYIKIRRYLNGGATIVCGERAFSLRPGATYLLDQSKSFSEISNDNCQLNVFIPLSCLGSGYQVSDPVLEWDDQTETGALLRAAIDAFFEQVRASSSQSPTESATEFCIVFNTLLEGGTDSSEEGAVRRARRRAIRNEIDRRVLCPSLTVEEIVTALPFSRAGLYRHFGDKAGIASYVRQRRLGLAFEALSANDQRRSSINEVAHLAGYSSVHSFTKAFKRAFGLTPGQLRGVRQMPDHVFQTQVSQKTSWSAAENHYKLAFQLIRGIN